MYAVQPASAQEPLTVEKIMQDPKWIGTSPSSPYWSANGKMLFFNWNPTQALADSLYYIAAIDPTPHQAPYSLKQANPSSLLVHYNQARTAYTWEREGDIFLTDAASGQEKRITSTLDIESSPVFSFDDSRIVYKKDGNLFAWEIIGGQTLQLTDFHPGAAPAPTPPLNAQESWLREDQLEYIRILRDRNKRRTIADSIDKMNKAKGIRPLYMDDRKLSGLEISPDGRFITYSLYKPAPGVNNSIVPAYVTESGFTREIPGRTKVGAPLGEYHFFIFDKQQDTVLSLPTDQSDTRNLRTAGLCSESR